MNWVQVASAAPSDERFFHDTATTIEYCSGTERIWALEHI